MSTPRTEQLPVVGARGGRIGLPLVPTLCGVVIAASWVAGCLTIVLPA